MIARYFLLDSAAFEPYRAAAAKRHADYASGALLSVAPLTDGRVLVKICGADDDWLAQQPWYQPARKIEAGQLRAQADALVAAKLVPAGLPDRTAKARAALPE